MIEQGLADLTEAHTVSTMREAPDMDWVNNFIAKIYTQIVKDSLT